MSDGNENSNGSSAQDTLTGQTVLNEELFEVHKNLLRDIWAAWGAHRDNYVKAVGHEANAKFPRVSIVTLTQVAAVCAVDVSMTEEQFLATCKANFEEATRKAPRWS